MSIGSEAGGQQVDVDLVDEPVVVAGVGVVDHGDDGASRCVEEVDDNFDIVGIGGAVEVVDMLDRDEG